MILAIVPFEPPRLAEMARLTSQGEAEGCFCAFLDLPPDEAAPERWSTRTPDQNRAVLESTVASGRLQGLLAYLDGEPAGWCRFGPRSHFPLSIEKRFERPPEDSVGCVACFSIVPAARGRGVARRLLAAAVDALRRDGFRAVEGFPRKGERLDPGHAWRGAVSLYAEAGFRAVGKVGQYAVMRRDLG